MKWVLRIVGGFLLVLVLGVAALAVVSHRAGAGRMHTSAELIGSPEQIWPWLNEGEKLKQWVSWLVEVRGWDNGGAVGAKRVWVMKDENNGGMLMEINGVCSAYSRPTLLTVQLSVADAFDGEQSYRLTDLGNGRTRIEVNSQYRFGSSLARLMEPLITKAARKKMVGDLAHLQALVESNTISAAR
jgi:hypothetical protein